MMKFKDVMNVNVNRANKQISFNLRKKQLRKLGMTPEELLEETILKPKVKFIKNIKGRYNK